MELFISTKKSMITMWNTKKDLTQFSGKLINYWNMKTLPSSGANGACPVSIMDTTSLAWNT